ncbi:fructose-6-phosphate aldolase [Metabacillus arenae]|uniref:Fructose-6-phosphate aldolase n=1 Tax=Metabacillus arenae TaxID=2771434 RepID=A0A926NDH4_9BACI|nr:fructose-6-phosphate aldolase [Metabacillus arenae]MBD1379509.1 fructose-6-phosphate aldolase [Metabacillus arenae]
MELIIDSASLETIKKLCKQFPIDGVTTNPSIIVREEGKPFLPLLKEILSLLEDHQTLHAQVLATDVDGIVEEGKLINQELDGRVFVKVPATVDGIHAIKELKKQKIKTTATTVYTPLQAYMAAKAGASYVAPYVNRIDNLTGNGVEVVKKIADLFERHQINCKILSASFKNIQQVLDVGLMGSHAITVSPDLIELFVQHPAADRAVNDFRNAWENEFGSLSIK